MIVTVLLLIVIVLGGSVLYMLNRLRCIDDTVGEINDLLRVKASMDDCYAVTMEVIKKENQNSLPPPPTVPAGSESLSPRPTVGTESSPSPSVSSSPRQSPSLTQ